MAIRIIASDMLLLASASPRRSALLTQIGRAHAIAATDVDERVLPGEAPAALVVRLARAKASAGAAARPEASAVIGADTVVALDDRVFGKPRDAHDGAAMLRALSGRTHTVWSGVAVACRGELEHRLSESHVRFRALDEAEIAAYWETGEPRDKAGAYAVQGLAAAFIVRLEGSYSGVMGLPLYETSELLARRGL